LNEFDQGHDVLSRALAIQERTFGHDHPRVALVLNDMGRLAYIRDQYDEAEQDFGGALAIWQRAYGEQHTFVGLACANLAGVYMQRRDYVAAEHLARRALAIYQVTLPPDHVNFGVIHVKLGRILLRQGRYAEAEPETLAGLHYFLSHESGEKSYLDGARGDLTVIQAHLPSPPPAAAEAR
jgi:eukaryotic-like serine/threonine-protein kinase